MQGCMSTSIAATREEISALRNRLEDDRRIRHNREACEALATIANGHPASRATRRTIDGIRDGLEVEMAKARRTAAELELRERQFALCLQSIFDLKSMLAEDSVGDMGNFDLGAEGEHGEED
eukprot:CAMPEP_0113301422 /NCGR_PEP_ID=MMETSP0010_2-20120614/2661_1 /TAXON_ID=216773 ORGANISM="Corethron hystrix, Strain 308" /NCGR_SAMPLE_ID=MMETSP0010_2 /ASSEMBLY_ACC=CAM_ASM_000155 /LENGTH=121 /DNA_ID=CAMNT_0000155049 /DNA_START=592 /DNA_END=957 /DNA_ORIENTATION=+ /assembly_acc=CAM_ASM_000155